MVKDQPELPVPPHDGAREHVPQQFHAFSRCFSGHVGKPVTFPPGRARLCTKPVPIGSATATMTIGMVDVARFAAKAQGVKVATIRSTGTRTAPQQAQAIVPCCRPRTEFRKQFVALQNSRTFGRPSRNAKVSDCASAFVRTRTPIRAGLFCCARAASGITAAPPSPAMNSRRLMARPEIRYGSAYRSD